MKSRKRIVVVCGKLAVVLIAGGSSAAYADKGGNARNPGNIAPIQSMVPKIGNPGIGNGLSGANAAMPPAIGIGRPVTSNAPMITLPAAASSAAIGRKNPDSPQLTAGAAEPGSKHGKAGNDKAGKDNRDSVSITSRAADKTSDQDKEQEAAQGKLPQPENTALSIELQEEARRDRLPSCV